MVISLMALLHDLLPCSVNVFRMKENFEKVVHEQHQNEENKEGRGSGSKVIIKRLSSYLASTQILTSYQNNHNAQKILQEEDSSDSASEDAESPSRSQNSISYNKKSDTAALGNLMPHAQPETDLVSRAHKEQKLSGELVEELSQLSSDLIKIDRGDSEKVQKNKHMTGKVARNRISTFGKKDKGIKLEKADQDEAFNSEEEDESPSQLKKV